MSSEMHFKPENGNLRVPPRSLQQLAYASLVLSLSPLVFAPLALGIEMSAAEFTHPNLWPPLVVLIAGHSASISALVIGIVVLIRARRYRLHQLPSWGIALAGAIIGGVGLVALALFDIFFVATWAIIVYCSGYPPGVCGP
jgi:hypothetical protein